jgi:hypothetical protein
MKRLLMGVAAAAVLATSGAAQAGWALPPLYPTSGKAGGDPTLVVSDSGNGRDNRVTVDPTRGEKVVINDSGNGRDNRIVVAPDPGGTVVVNASGNGRGNKIIVEEAPGEHVVIRGSGNGRNNNIVIEKVPGHGPIRPLAAQHPERGGSSRSGRR